MTEFDRDPSRYLPHRPPMLLIDSVEAADGTSARCRVCVGEQCALFLEADGTYPASLFIEFMAQTVGVYAGVRDAGGEPRVGFLLGSRSVKLAKDPLHEGEVYDIEAECSFFGEDALPSQFDCRVTEKGVEVARAVLTVFRPAGLEQFIQEIEKQ